MQNPNQSFNPPSGLIHRYNQHFKSDKFATRCLTHEMTFSDMVLTPHTLGHTKQVLRIETRVDFCEHLIPRASPATPQLLCPATIEDFIPHSAAHHLGGDCCHLFDFAYSAKAISVCYFRKLINIGSECKIVG